MVIMRVKAFADFDIPYEIDLAVLEKKEVADEICKVLNGFCERLEGCHQDVKLMKYLAHKDWVDKLAKELRENTKIDKYQVNLFIENLISVCEENYVYIYPDIFSVKWIMNLI